MRVYQYDESSRVQLVCSCRIVEFHGEGRLVFADSGAIYTARWDRGVEVAGSGEYKFKDGLVGSTDADWDHLTPGDRRFWSEHQRKTIRPGDTVARYNESDSGLGPQKK